MACAGPDLENRITMVVLIQMVMAMLQRATTVAMKAYRVHLKGV